MIRKNGIGKLPVLKRVEPTELLNPVNERRQILAGDVGTGGKRERLNTVLVVKHDGLRDFLTVLRIGEDGDGRRITALCASGDASGVLLPGIGCALRGAARGEPGAQLGQRHRRGGRRVLGFKRGAAVFNGALQGLCIKCFAGGRCDQRFKQRVGQLRSRGDVQRGCLIVRLQRGDDCGEIRRAACSHRGDGCGGSRRTVCSHRGDGCGDVRDTVCSSRGESGRRIRQAVYLGGLPCGADEPDDLLDTQAALGQELHEQRAIVLRFGAEQRAAILSGAGRKQREQVIHRLRVARDLSTLLGEQHHVAVGIDNHHARMGRVEVFKPHVGQMAQLLRGNDDAALLASSGHAREGDANHPRAGIARTKKTQMIDIHGEVHVIRPRID